MLFRSLGAGVIHRTSEGNYRQCWLEEVPAGGSKPLEFSDVAEAALYRPWKNLADYQSLDERCRINWARAFGDAGEAELARLLELPELKPYRNQALQFLRRLVPSVSASANPRISFSQYKQTYIQLFRANEKNRLGLGEMFEALSSSLLLAPGEMRLIARTSDLIGEQQLTPAATQSSRSTLVLAHLKPAPFPEVKSDLNALADYLGKSDLDLNREREDDQEENPRTRPK